MITTYKIQNDSGSALDFGTISIPDATTHLILQSEILDGSAVILDIPQYANINTLLGDGTVKAVTTMV